MAKDTEENMFHISNFEEPKSDSILIDQFAEVLTEEQQQAISAAAVEEVNRPAKEKAESTAKGEELLAADFERRTDEETLLAELQLAKGRGDEGKVLERSQELLALKQLQQAQADQKTALGEVERQSAIERRNIFRQGIAAQLQAQQAAATAQNLGGGRASSSALQQQATIGGFSSTAQFDVQTALQESDATLTRAREQFETNQAFLNETFALGGSITEAGAAIAQQQARERQAAANRGSIISMTLAGAGAGAATGNPWGVAIGAGAGFITGLTQSSNSFEEELSDVFAFKF